MCGVLCESIANMCCATCYIISPLQADWTVNLGDHAISIRIPRQLPGRPAQLLVLGERGVYCCLETGQLRFMMKLEVNPSCVFPYGLLPPMQCELYSYNMLR